MQAGASDVSLRITGTLQTRVSYGFTSGGDLAEGQEVERVGFGLRRARLRFTGTFSSRIGAHYDMDLASGTLASTDLYVFYRPTDRVRVRLGYLVGAQPRSYARTSHTRIDAAERPAISDRWARGTIGSSGRDFGIDVRYQTPEVAAEIFLHNGDGSFDRSRSNYREGVSGLDATRGTDRMVLAASASLSYEPEALGGLGVGGYVGYNGARGPNTEAEGTDEGRGYLSYSGHVYWGASPGSQPLRVKLDALAIQYEDLDGFGQQTARGASILGAARIARGAEAFARIEQFGAGLDAETDTYVTLGVSASPSARRGLAYRQERLTLAYANGLPGADGAADQHLVVLQAQIVF